MKVKERRLCPLHQKNIFSSWSREIYCTNINWAILKKPFSNWGGDFINHCISRMMALLTLIIWFLNIFQSSSSLSMSRIQLHVVQNSLQNLSVTLMPCSLVSRQNVPFKCSNVYSMSFLIESSYFEKSYSDLKIDSLKGVIVQDYFK